MRTGDQKQIGLHQTPRGSHFSVDGTLLDAWASQKSVRPKDESDQDRPDLSSNDWVDFSGTKRTNDTHGSVTDPEALLARKSNGEAARPRYCGHAVIENRNGLVVAASLSQATGTAERDEAIALIKDVTKGRRATLAADKGYDTKDFVEQCRESHITPHVAAKSDTAQSMDGPPSSRDTESPSENENSTNRSLAGPRPLEWPGSFASLE